METTTITVTRRSQNIGYDYSNAARHTRTPGAVKLATPTGNLTAKKLTTERKGARRVSSGCWMAEVLSVAGHRAVDSDQAMREIECLWDTHQYDGMAGMETIYDVDHVEVEVEA